jgi:hypothetical protein
MSDNNDEKFQMGPEILATVIVLISIVLLITC